jgi:hypothetical protein
MKRNGVVSLLVLLFFSTLLLAQSFKTFHPTIVAKTSFLNQTGNISATSVFTPTTDADLIVTFFGEGPTTNTDNVNFGLLCSTDFNSSAGCGGVTLNAGSSVGSFVVVIHQKANNPVQVEVNLNGTGSALYNLFVTVQEN